ncbi:heme/hemin ABC transporter substrate-binding protein [Roseicyclus sp.]|uniref:heme/hemin ABC transporter substrate-binding protein n=1 Tax=Roseicyclus sp. TaxID=1914329 RepID=UPI003FA11642
MPRHARLRLSLSFSALCLTVSALLAAGVTAPARADAPERVVALGGVVTEIVFALGAGDLLVARDTTSTHPAEAEALPDVGYVRALSPEGVLSVDPDLILAIEGSGPPETIDVLAAANVPLVTVPEGHDAAAIRARIEAVAGALGLEEAGAALADSVEAELAEAVAAARRDVPPRVLFVLSMQGGRIMAAGEGTGASAIIELAGGVNALSGFEGYKQVGDEAVLLSAPDVILMMDRSGDHAADDAGIRAHPALGTTPAAEAGAIVRLPGLLLLGFGPRTPEAVRALSHALDRTGS